MLDVDLRITMRWQPRAGGGECVYEARETAGEGPSPRGGGGTPPTRSRRARGRDHPRARGEQTKKSLLDSVAFFECVTFQSV